MEDLTKLSEDVAKSLFGKDKKPTLPVKSDNYVVLEEYGLMVMKKDLGGLVNFSTAVELCANSSLGGLSGWRLPTKIELSMIYSEKDVIGGFVTQGNRTWYWSSDSKSNSNAQHHWVYDFDKGSLLDNYHLEGDRCRCVRTSK